MMCLSKSADDLIPPIVNDCRASKVKLLSLSNPDNITRDFLDSGTLKHYIDHLLQLHRTK